MYIDLSASQYNWWPNVGCTIWNWALNNLTFSSNSCNLLNCIIPLTFSYYKHTYGYLNIQGQHNAPRTYLWKHYLYISSMEYWIPVSALVDKCCETSNACHLQNTKEYFVRIFIDYFEIVNFVWQNRKLKFCQDK